MITYKIKSRESKNIAGLKSRLDWHLINYLLLIFRLVGLRFVLFIKSRSSLDVCQIWDRRCSYFSGTLEFGPQMSYKDSFYSGWPNFIKTIVMTAWNSLKFPKVFENHSVSFSHAFIADRRCCFHGKMKIPHDFVFVKRLISDLKIDKYW